jgi:hypothetical protein
MSRNACGVFPSPRPRLRARSQDASGGSFSARMNGGVRPLFRSCRDFSDCCRKTGPHWGLHPGRRFALQRPTQGKVTPAWLRKPSRRRHPGETLGGAVPGLAPGGRSRGPRAAGARERPRPLTGAHQPRRAAKKSRISRLAASSPIPP